MAIKGPASLAPLLRASRGANSVGGASVPFFQRFLTSAIGALAFSLALRLFLGMLLLLALCRFCHQRLGVLLLLAFRLFCNQSAAPHMRACACHCVPCAKQCSNLYSAASAFLLWAFEYPPAFSIDTWQAGDRRPDYLGYTCGCNYCNLGPVTSCDCGSADIAGLHGHALHAKHSCECRVTLLRHGQYSTQVPWYLLLL